MARIEQGQLNLARVGASCGDAALTSLNVSATMLGADMIDVTQSEDATQLIPTATGAVVSPKFAVPVEITLDLVKTTPVAEAYKQALRTNSIIGDYTVTWDASNLTTETFHQCVIQSIPTKANGSEATIKVKLAAVRYTNDAKL